MSYKLKNLKKALDEQIPAPELNKDLLTRAQESRPKSKSTFAVRALTTAAAVVLIVLSLSSMFEVFVNPNVDSIFGSSHHLSEVLTPQPTDSGEEQVIPSDAENYFPDNVGDAGAIVGMLDGYIIWYVCRIIFKARRKQLRHILIETGFLIYCVALILLAYRPMSGGTFWVMDDSILHSSGTVYQWYGEPLISTHISTEAVYMAVFGWSAASTAFMASFSAAYPKLRKRGILLLVLAAVMLLPWAWKAVCLDMDATQWRILSNLVFYVLPSVVILVFLVPAVKRWMERFFKWCDRFEDLTAYSGASRKFWWWLIAAALLNLCLGSYYSGQELDSLTRHTEVTYGYNEYCDEEWFSSVNESYALYREKMDAGDEQGALHALWKAEDDLADFAVLAMYEHQIDELTPDRLLMVWTDVKLATKRPFYRASIKLEYADTPYTLRLAEDKRLSQGRADLPISAIWFNAGNKSTTRMMDPSNMITECEMRAFMLCIMPEQQADTQDILENVTMHLCIEQYPYFDFAMQKVYTARSRLDGSVFDEQNHADMLGQLTGDFYPAIIFGIVCLLSVLIGRLYRRHMEKETYIDDDDDFVDLPRRIMRMVRRCLAAVMIIMLVSSWLVIIAGLRGNELFGRESTWYMGFISFRGNLVLGIKNMPVLSAIAAVCFAIVPTYGLIYSIYQLISPRREGSRHWFLLAFLSYELFFQTCMWLLGVDDASVQEIARTSRIMMPTAVMTGAAWILTLIQNIYYKVIER